MVKPHIVAETHPTAASKQREWLGERGRQRGKERDARVPIVSLRTHPQ